MAGWQAIEITGPDARDFLHRLTSANFMRLEPGEFTPGTLLSSTGKIQLYFKALMLENARYLLLLPPQSAGDAAQNSAQIGYDAFERLHFRENLVITPQPDAWIYLRVLASDESRMKTLSTVLPERGGLKKLSDGRVLLNEGRWSIDPVKLDLGMVVPASRLAAITAGLRDAGYDEAQSLEPFRLRAFDPAAPFELNASTIPLEVKLDDAVHENKGCYPGQEVVERIRSMGQTPRVLGQFTGQGEAPPAPSEIRSGDAVVGSLTSAAQDPISGGWVGLGLIRRTGVSETGSYSINNHLVTAILK